MLLPTFTNSISVTLTSPAGLSRDAARELWERWFHRAEDGKDKDRGKPESEEEEATAKAAPVLRPSSASISGAAGAPASNKAPTVMSPLIPENASK